MIKNHAKTIPSIEYRSIFPFAQFASVISEHISLYKVVS